MNPITLILTLLTLFTHLTSAIPVPIPSSATPDTLQPAFNDTSHGLFKLFKMDCGSDFLTEMCTDEPEFYACNPISGKPTYQKRLEVCQTKCRCVNACLDGTPAYLAPKACLGGGITFGSGGLHKRDEVVEKKIEVVEKRDEVMDKKTEVVETRATDTEASNTTSHGLFKSFKLECGNTFLNDMCPQAPEVYACDEKTGKPTYQRKLQICQKNCRCVDACLGLTPAAMAPKACLGGGIGIGSGSIRTRDEVVEPVKKEVKEEVVENGTMDLEGDGRG